MGLDLWYPGGDRGKGGQSQGVRGTQKRGTNESFTPPNAVIFVDVSGNRPVGDVWQLCDSYYVGKGKKGQIQITASDPSHQACTGCCT